MKKYLIIAITVYSNLFGFSQNTLIPDVNFEQALIDAGYDTGSPDGVVQTANISGIYSLYINSKNISDLTGIEDFTSLTYFFCGDNNLTTIDISNNTNIETLYCELNQLTSIDLSNNIKLRNISISYNNIQTLDINANTLLETIYCNNSGLTSLNISNQPNLKFLWCDSNNIQNLDVTNNPNLQWLVCGENNLSSLDVSKNTVLVVIRINNNNFKTIDLSANTLLTEIIANDNDLCELNIKTQGNNLFVLDIQNNPNLPCVEVSDVSYANSNYIYKDNTTSYSTTCGDNCAPLVVKENLQEKISVFPNPSENQITIEGAEINSEYTITDYLGKTVLKGKIEHNTQVLNMGSLPQGVYVLKMNESKIKLIKN